MADEARHHHYIPQGYLRGFAQKRGERQWYVHVNDLEAKRSYMTNVRNVCGQRDFMRVEMDGYEPEEVGQLGRPSAASRGLTPEVFALGAHDETPAIKPAKSLCRWRRPLSLIGDRDSSRQAINGARY